MILKKKWVIILLIGLVGLGVYNLKKEGVDQTKGKSLIEESSAIQPVTGIQKGNLAPDFELVTTEGKHIKLSELRGKRLILNMWATWCPPCKAEVPELERFYEDNHKDGLEILAVDLTESEKSKEDVTAFIRDYKITYPVVLDERGEVARKYQVTSIPTTYVINTAGIIQQKYIGPLNYKSLKEIFDKMN
jgi:peroxiredoxin